MIEAQTINISSTKEKINNKEKINDTLVGYKFKMNDDKIVKIKKKRGRKPKIKSNEPRILKKRGRKPKIKTITEKKVLQKRGRKPKKK